jgi:hypothetical protein
MKIRRWGVLALAGLCLAALGCDQAIGTAVSSAKARSDAERIANKYFELARARDWSGARSLYHEEFFKAMPWETWRKILPNVDAKLGPLQACTQNRWQVTRKASTTFTGTAVLLTYTCKHERYEATVSFTIARASGDREYSIYAQTFNSIGFLIE